jgi:hypothetical protein
MKNLMKNKRGDVTITVLVIGVFALCTLAMVSFYYASFEVRDASTGLGEMEKMNSNIEKYFGPVDLRDDFEEDVLKIDKDKQGNEFFMIEEKDDDVVIFQVKYYLK